MQGILVQIHEESRYQLEVESLIAIQICVKAVIFSTALILKSVGSQVIDYVIATKRSLQSGGAERLQVFVVDNYR